MRSADVSCFIVLALCCACAKSQPPAEAPAPEPQPSDAPPSMPAPTTVSAAELAPDDQPEPPARTRREALRRGAKKLRKCYVRALKSDPEAHGRVILTLRIDADGRVVEASAKSDPGVRQFEPCLLDVARGFVFPPPEPLDDRVMKIPILFVPGR